MELAATPGTTTNWHFLSNAIGGVGLSRPAPEQLAGFPACSVEKRTIACVPFLMFEEAFLVAPAMVCLMGLGLLAQRPAEHSSYPADFQAASTENRAEAGAAAGRAAVVMSILRKSG